MKIYRKLSVMAMAALVTATGFTSCSSDDLDTNQYNKSGVNILAFGPMPITHACDRYPAQQCEGGSLP